MKKKKQTFGNQYTMFAKSQNEDEEKKNCFVKT